MNAAVYNTLHLHTYIRRVVVVCVAAENGMKIKLIQFYFLFALRFTQQFSFSFRVRAALTVED